MKSLIVGLFFTFGSLLFGQNLTLDKSHARLQFFVTHMTISTVDGKFNEFDVVLNNFDQNDITKSTITVVAQTNSIDTGIEARDNHLKSADFFDVAQYKTIEFKSTSLEKIIGNTYKLNGNLTMSGVTKPITLTLVYNGNSINSANNIKSYGFTIKGTINRSSYEIGKKIPESVIGNDIKILSNLEFTQNKKKK
ncbi:YceI family protein [Weeksella virosa]|uniref:YceI family protein n=1 Tax=Weeksella virosa TaxID=1014 RepID=UPI000E0158F3|nr:YceI family protein [Weeksella virosa]MDK7674932.1 YceI family protein [Weeksella virosa]SUP53260.1 Uncharacterized conserved protein [Weeksella virosa]